MPISAALPFTIREFRPEDRPGLEAMYRSFRPRGAAKGLPPVRDEKTERWLGHLDLRARNLVAIAGENDRRVVGHGILAESDRGVAEFALFVHQDFRGMGLGTALTRAAIELARERGYRRLWLIVSTDNTAAIRTCEKCGFRVLGARWFPDHEMELWLDSGAATEGA